MEIDGILENLCKMENATIQAVRDLNELIDTYEQFLEGDNNDDDKEGLKNNLNNFLDAMQELQTCGDNIKIDPIKFLPPKHETFYALKEGQLKESIKLQMADIIAKINEYAHNFDVEQIEQDDQMEIENDQINL
ncbi:hypothetical protein pb186bvf_015388 [Paramecium bursaria]